ncbi:33424_t:CDS:2, partial [Gigaspora margarita]
MDADEIFEKSLVFDALEPSYCNIHPEAIYRSSFMGKTKGN